MNEKDLIDFANWLWDIGRLKVKTQTPPFEDAEYWAKQYIKVRKLNIPDVSKRILAEKLSIAEKALTDIRNWDDDLEDEYADQGYRAIEALEKIQSVC